MDHERFWRMIYRPASLVFKIVHIDKAGETWDHRVVEAEVADVDESGNVLLVTRDGVIVHFPLDELHVVGDADAVLDLTQSYIGGQELTRNFHPHDDEPRTTLRWLARPEVEELLADL